VGADVGWRRQNQSVEWPDIYARLRRDREDAPAWEALERGVRGWARPDLWDHGWHVVGDVVADTCSAVVVTLEAAHGGETFVGFVRGHYLNARRRAFRDRRRPEVPLAPDGDLPVPAPESWPAEEQLRALKRCLSTLSPREQVAVRLRHFEGRTSAEMATVLGVTEGNARRILCLGVARLRRCLQDTAPAGRTLPAPVPPGPVVEAAAPKTAPPGHTAPRPGPHPGQREHPDVPEGGIGGRA
jgi:RNA polymerase sigma factor (sigma-70 family)